MLLSQALQWFPLLAESCKEIPVCVLQETHRTDLRRCDITTTFTHLCTLHESENHFKNAAFMSVICSVKHRLVVTVAAPSSDIRQVEAGLQRPGLSCPSPARHANWTDWSDLSGRPEASSFCQVSSSSSLRKNSSLHR